MYICICIQQIYINKFIDIKKFTSTCKHKSVHMLIYSCSYNYHTEDSLKDEVVSFNTENRYGVYFERIEGGELLQGEVAAIFKDRKNMGWLAIQTFMVHVLIIICILEHLYEYIYVYMIFKYLYNACIYYYISFSCNY
jgi:hypothetical protein